MASTELEASIAGSWVTTAGPNRRWEGAIRANSPYALLLVATLPTTTIWAKSQSNGKADLSVIFDVDCLGSDERVQLILFAGGAWIQDVVVRLPASASLPTSCAPAVLGPAALHPIFRAESEPVVSFGMLLLPRSEVAVGRTGVWRLRQPRPDLSAELTALANAGRAGKSARG